MSFCKNGCLDFIEERKDSGDIIRPANRYAIERELCIMDSTLPSFWPCDAFNN